MGTYSTNPAETVVDFYSAYDEEGRLGRRYGQVEFLTTMRYINKHLTPGARVLEIGAGSGRYSRAIADMGYAVDAVELVAHNIEIFKQHITPQQNITVTQGNALDLSAFASAGYDITLLLGPMYHLYTAEDKHAALQEALRVTKPGGVVFVAYCISDASIIYRGFARKGLDVGDYIRRGKIDPTTFATHSEPEDIFELVRREDIDALMAHYPVQRLHYVATDLFSVHMHEALEEMSDDQFALYLQYHFAVCERPDMVGITHHSLDILRKG
ncbi:MAG: methyltransferase domain-containing protein [Oscillospiraceae bacterium]|nr:methyltransferase domain-containing protein [Oscillospiraceae bacterium]